MSSQRARLMRRATYASVMVASVLLIAKIGAWGASGSISLLSTLVDSLLDGVASLINLLAIRKSLEPADKEHRFGHGKAEPLASLAQAAFIAGSVVFLLLGAGERLLNPQAVTNSGPAILVMLFSIGLTMALLAYQRHVIRQTESVAIKADALHYQTDLLVNAAVIGALLLSSELGWIWADPVFGILIAGYILVAVRNILKDSLDMLMDRELPAEDRKRIRELVLGHRDVRGVHDLRTRSVGTQVFAQMHVEMDPDISLRRAHDIADQVVISVLNEFPDSEVIVHQDPDDIDEERDEFTEP
jgi:ferrous-iron efflux pump FieF